MTAPDELRFDDVPRFRRILVPMKLGIIGEEMAATAVKLAAEHGAAVEALFVIRVPLDQPLDAAMSRPRRSRAASLAEAKALGEELGVEVVTTGCGRARSAGRSSITPARPGRPDRARLVAALAAAVALLLPDRRLRPPAGALRGADRRVPAAGARRGARHDLIEPTARRALSRLLSYAGLVKVLVIGCGRVGSAVALELRAAGWDVSVIDEREDALGRLGDDWSGEFHVGHGMDIQLLRDAGIEDADAVVVTTDGDNSNIVIGQMAQKQFDVPSVVVRVLDPARAEFYKPRAA